MLRAGKLRHQIVVQSGPATQDGYGDTRPAELDNANWSDSVTLFAAIRAQQGREYEAGDTIQADQTHVFETRWTSTLLDLNTTPNTALRVKWGTRYFDVVSIQDPDGMSRRLWIAAKERS